MEAQCPHPFLNGPGLPDVCSANGTALFLTMLNTLITVHPKIGDPCGRVTPVKRPNLVYDFVVVGGGASGPAVAARLSEVENWNVLLLEAGPDEPAGTQVPSNLQLYLNTELDWKYKTTNESHACLSTKGSCSWPRGKNLGGCTSHHGMAYHRGHPKDYERWVEMGNVGWSYEEVLPIYKKSEDNKEIGRVSAKYHGTGGPMTVERFRWQPDFAWAILDAANETGLGVSEDLVGDKITGFTVAQTLSKDGVRQSAAAAYLRPYRNRKNLHVALNATATKVLVTGKKATGVQYVLNGVKRTVRVKREVILTAGTVNSAQLLLLSGIGPKEHLKKMKIPVKKDLPGVGENLHNHVSFGVDFNINQPYVSELSVPSGEEYVFNQTGPMSSTGLAQVTGILPSSLTTPDDPDIQLFFAGYQATCQSKTQIADLGTYNNKITLRFTAVNVQTRSRGRLTLASKDPMEHPEIWGNDLDNPEDITILIEGVHYIQQLANSTVMKKWGLKMVKDPVRQCAHLPFDSDKYLACAMKWNTRPENHQSGSCKMGPSSDPLAVVDPRLMVHGMKNLRVADASIFPKVVSGNPVSAVTMIGERAAMFIKEDHGIRSY